MNDAAPASAFASLGELRAVQARLGERRRTETASTAFWDAVDDFVQRGSATGVLLDNPDERWTIQGLLDYWATALERSGRPRRDSMLVEFDAGLAPALADDACPYLGLSAFEEGDVGVFFGRDALLGQVIEQLAEQRLIALVGPSGSGKSSLAAAGLVGRLRKGALPGSESWHVVPPMVPGDHPRETLAMRLADAPAGSALVVVVDQFEELFTLCASETERAAFVAELLALATRASPAHRVVLTVRTDFEGLVARYPALYDRFNAGRVTITPPSAAELRRAIEGPAATVGLKFEAGVIDRLIQELLGEPAGLPLLQFTLLQLWRTRERNRVTMASYLRVGGGRQALARAADAVYDTMIPEDQATARRILLKLGLAVDDRHEPTRMRVPRSQLLTGEDPGRVDRVLDKLIAARLVRQTTVTRDAAPDVEVAHEALVRNWPRLAEWLQEAQAGLAERRRLELRAADWVLRGRMSQGLLDEVELRDAERWLGGSAGSLGVSAQLSALVEASRQQLQRAARRHRLALLASTAATLLLTVSLWLSVHHYRGALRARKEEANSEAKNNRLLGMSYLEQGRALLLDSHPVHPMRALPYLVAAREQGIDSVPLRMLFAQALPGLPRVTLVGHGAAVTAAVYSSDGMRVATASDDHTARIWDIASGRSVATLGHSGDVSAVAFSPDGTRVVTASLDKTARIWDARTGTPVTPLLQHDDAVQTAAFSPDGKLVVTASFDRTARIWDAAGHAVTPPLVHGDSVRAASFSPDGRFVVTASDDDSARVWDARTGLPVTPPLMHHDAVVAASFSRDAAYVVTGSEDRSARVWSTMTGKPVGPPLEHDSSVTAVSFAPEGDRVVTASDDHTARVWHVPDGRPLSPPLRHRGSVRSARFSADGTRVVTASNDSTAQIWDAMTGDSLGVLEHIDNVASAEFSPDGEHVVTASDDKLIRIWDISTAGPPGEPPAQRLVDRFELEGGQLVFPNEADALDALRSKTRGRSLWTAQAHGFSPSSGDDDDAVTAVADNPAIRVHAMAMLHIATHHLFAAPHEPIGITASRSLQHDDAVAAAAFSPDGKRVVTASWDRTARIWDVGTGAPVAPPLEHDDVVAAAAFSPDGMHVITETSNGTVRLWNSDTGTPDTRPFRNDRGASIAFSPDGERVVTADDRTAQIYDVWTARPATPPLRHDATVTTAAFSADGMRVVTASSDGVVRIWNAITGTALIRPLKQPGAPGAVNAAAFSPDGELVITASGAGTAQVWRTATGKPSARPLKHLDAVNAAVFSPDGKRVATASDDGTARVWDAESGEPLTAPLEHGAPVRAVAFSPDGSLVVTASFDRTARVWDATGGPIVPPLVQRGLIYAAAFSPDGNRVITASADKTARIWNLPLPDRGSLDDWRAVARCSLFTLINGVLTSNPEPDLACSSRAASTERAMSDEAAP